MNRIHEELEYNVAIIPVQQAAGGNTTSAYIDTTEYLAMDFVVEHGALAAGKKLTVEVLHAPEADGASAAAIISAKKEVIAPTGGLVSGTVVVSIRPRAEYGKCFAIKVTNDAAAAVPVSALALGRVKHLPAGNAQVTEVW